MNYPGSVSQQVLRSHELRGAKNPNYTLRRLGALAGLAGALFGLGKAGEAAYHWGFDETVIGTTTTGILPGDGGVETVCAAVKSIAQENAADTNPDNDFDPQEVDNCVYAGQEVNGELSRMHSGRAIRPGDQINVVVTESRFGGLRVYADPAALPRFS